MRRASNKRTSTTVLAHLARRLPGWVTCSAFTLLWSFLRESSLFLSDDFWTS